ITMSAMDTVTVTAGPDLFCTNQAVLIPAASGYFPRSVAIGDLDSDGRNDVVMATWTSYTPAVDFLYVFLQDASGGLKPPVAYQAGNGKAIAVGDLNGDGRNDLAVTLNDGVGVLYQNGSGGFDPVSPFGYGESVDVYSFHDVRIADLNNDGRMDLATLYNRFDNAVVNVYYRNLDGTLKAPVKYTTDFGEWELRAGDWNNDGLADLVMFSNKRGSGGSFSYGSYVKVMLQNADGSLEDPTDYLAVSGTFGIEAVTFAAGDVTGDARPDLAIGYLDTSVPFAATYSIGLFPQQADGSAGTPAYLPAFEGIRQLEVIDVSGDLRNDVVGYHSGNTTAVTVYRQGEQGALAAYELYGLPFPNYNSFNHAFAVGDLNGDGFQDIAVADAIDNETGGLVVLYGNSGRGSR
ncbi:MAG TPA: VCBS repeat-containing protein, partial [Candidatus Aquicultoraceae bacterium]|nr:VCBS repeat-containing protein [Candidatus Aquicultoraceae bacterium]